MMARVILYTCAATKRGAPADPLLDHQTLVCGAEPIVAWVRAHREP